MDQIKISRTQAARINTLGVAPAALLRQARLPPNFLNKEPILLTTAQWFALWYALEKLTNDPTVGLKIPVTIEGGPYEPLLITTLSAPSFHAALCKMARYKRLFTPEDLRVVQEGSLWSVEVAWFTTQEPTPSPLVEWIFRCLLDLGHSGTGRVLSPERILLQREPIERAFYETTFHCPVDFGADRNQMLFRQEVMDQPFTTYNPDLLAMLETQLEAALQDRNAQEQFVGQVKTLLRSRMAGQLPTIQNIAGELNISARTLQRRLEGEGIRFQQLVETVRHELATQYLTDASLELKEIAFLLGYQEASSFHRAFHQWEGVSPGQWRDKCKTQKTTTVTL